MNIYKFTASIDGSLPIDSTTRPDEDESPEQSAKETIVKQAHSRGQTDITEDHVEIISIELK